MPTWKHFLTRCVVVTTLSLSFTVCSADEAATPASTDEPTEGVDECTPWTRHLGSPESDGARSVATDGEGNIYVAGTTHGSLDGQSSAGDYDAFVARYAVDGTLQWTKQFGTPELDGAAGVAVDEEGNVYVAGFTRGNLDGQASAEFQDAFLTKFDVTGSQVWTRQVGTSASDHAEGVATDGAGNVYVVGTTSGRLEGQTHAGGPDIFVIQYDGLGNHQWTRQFGGPENDSVQDLAVDDHGVYVTGYTVGTLPGLESQGGQDAFVIRYDASGNRSWVRQFGTERGDQGRGVAIDGVGAVYVAGVTRGSFEGETQNEELDAFVAQLDSEGNLQWVKQLGSAAEDRAMGVAVHGADVYVTGSTEGSFDGTSAAGERDAFVARYDVTGSHHWVQQLGSPEDDGANGVAVDDEGNVYVAGATSGSLDGETLVGERDAFVMRICEP